MSVCHCRIGADCAINDARRSVRSTLVMKGLKRTAFGLSLIALTVFAAEAQTANYNKLAFNDLSGKAKADTLDNKAMTSPVVFKGTAGDADLASDDEKFSIHIIGRKDSQMSAQKYATLLANGFADRKYTDKPMYITVTYEESDEAGKTVAAIFMNRIRYKTKEGYNLFTPEQIGSPGGIQALGNIFVDRHGDKNVLKEGISPTLLVSSLD